jgi:HlyD family secretion protein
MNIEQKPAKEQIAETIGLTPGEQPKSNLRLYFLAAAVAVVLASALIFLTGGSDVKYLTGTVERGPLVVRVSATGTLKPVNQVDVGVEISGLINEVFVDFNDSVKVDQPLAELDTEQLAAGVIRSEANLESARASLSQAEATVRETEARRNRVVNLAKNRTVSEQDVEIVEAELSRAKASVANAVAQIRIAEAALAIEKTTLEKAVIRSPINGIVLDRTIEPGQTVASSFQTPVLFTLAEDLREMRLHVDVDEADVGHVKEGQEATFSVDAYPARNFSAHVQSVRYAPQSVQGVVTYEAVLTVNNDDLALRPGMTATAEITTAKLGDVLTAPNGALRFTPQLDEQAAAKLDPLETRLWRIQNGAPTAIAVTAGPSDGMRTTITGDIQSGATVLLDIVREEP